MLSGATGATEWYDTGDMLSWAMPDRRLLRAGMGRAMGIFERRSRGRMTTTEYAGQVDACERSH